MNFFIIILNRVYLLLVKVKNQSPLLGSVILVTILISFNLINIFSLYYAFKEKPLIVGTPFFLFFNILIFIPLLFYANRCKLLIIDRKISSPNKKSMLVLLLYLFTILSFIYLANVNRRIISNQYKIIPPTGQEKESLERRIRRWFE